MPTRKGRTRELVVPVLGVDVGGVLVDRDAENSDTSFFGDRPMDTPAVAGALNALRTLAPLFDYRVHIISKAGPKIAALSRQWLGQHGFTEIISPACTWFVRRRPEKAPICADLGITHFVDDRPDVLDALTTVTHRYLFVGGFGANPVPNYDPRRHTITSDWDDLTRRITTSLHHFARPIE